MEKIWLQSYTPGVPTEINPDEYNSIIEVIDQSFKQFPNRPAFYNFGRTITYQELNELSRDFAAFLQTILKLEKGMRFAIMMPNCLQYPVSMFGGLRAGLTIVNVNPLYTPNELKYQLNDCGANALIVLENFAHTVEAVLTDVPSLKHVIVTAIGDLLKPVKGVMLNFILKYIAKKIPEWQIPEAISLKKILREGKGCELKPVSIHQEDIAFLQYTGGTTGVAKGAMLTHRNFIANIEQAHSWFKGVLKTDDEVIITALPLYHIFSLTANCLFFTKIGGLNVLITNPRDIFGMMHEIKKFKFTAITGVNTLFNAMLHYKDFKTLDFSHLHLTLGGGMAVQKKVAEKWQNITKSPLLEAYGLTEASPCVTINPAHLKSYNGTIGLPVPSTDIAILDESGVEVPLGTSGELAIKGPQVMKGYWNHSKENEHIFTPDGWLLTGDIAFVDELGFVHLIERKKDMILVSGFNVYPKEIEDVLVKMPGVSEVAVVACQDDHSGEAVKAFIVREDLNLTEKEILVYAKANLTPYKVPKYITFINELPKSNVGKILRRVLRDMPSK